MSNDDLRQQAANAIANYMHHELYDDIPVNMLPWLKEQGDIIMGMCDRAIAATKTEGQRRGLIK